MDCTLYSELVGDFIRVCVCVCMCVYYVCLCMYVCVYLMFAIPKCLTHI